MLDFKVYDISAVHMSFTHLVLVEFFFFFFFTFYLHVGFFFGPWQMLTSLLAPFPSLY